MLSLISLYYPVPGNCTRHKPGNSTENRLKQCSVYLTFSPKTTTKPVQDDRTTNRMCWTRQGHHM